MPETENNWVTALDSQVKNHNLTQRPTSASSRTTTKDKPLLQPQLAAPAQLLPSDEQQQCHQLTVPNCGTCRASAQKRSPASPNPSQLLLHQSVLLWPQNCGLPWVQQGWIMRSFHIHTLLWPTLGGDSPRICFWLSETEIIDWIINLTTTTLRSTHAFHNTCVMTKTACCQELDLAWKATLGLALI